MSDQAISRVDRLVDCRARQARNDHRDDGRDDPIEKILCQTFDSRSSDACFIECLGITANDVRYRLPRGADTAALERIGNTGDMLIQATLGDQRAGDNRSTDEPEWQKQ